MKSEEVFNQVLAQIEQNSSGKAVSYIVNAGDMNHGKSSLFNSLIGHEEFKVRDVRETVVNKEYQYTEDIVFIDTPGLCATDDDNAIAFEAYKKASCIIFVHNVKAGMLHKNELQEINQISNLFNDKQFFWKHFCLVFTFKEAIENNEDVETKVNDSIKSIHAECNAMPFSVFSVSNSRFQKGIAQGKKGLIKHSGILELKEFIDSSLENIRSDEKQLRRNRMTQLCDDAISRLQGRRREIDLAISKKRQNTNREIEEKRRNVLAVLDGYVNSSTELRDVQKKVERIQQEVDRLRAKHKAEKF